jgi:hypothetical protein
MNEGRKHTIVRSLGVGCLAISLIGATGCKKKSPPPSPALSAANPDAISKLSDSTNVTEQEPKIADGENVSVTGGGESYAHVAYNPNVKIIDVAEVDSSLMGISSDGHDWVFQNAPASVRALKAGDVFMVKNEMAVKVIGAVTQGDKTLVATDEASLRDLVQSGDIKLDAPVRFHGPKNTADARPRPRSLFDLIEPAVYAAQSSIGPNGAAARAAGTTKAEKNVAKKAKSFLTSGWKIATWDITPGDGQANFDLVMTKSKDGFVAIVSMKGWIGNFDIGSNLTLSASAPKQLAQTIKHSQGNIEFNWEIGKSEGGGWTTLDPIKLPAAMSVPLAPLLGGLPLTLDISAALQIHPVLTGSNEFSKGGFTVTWGGASGFQTTSGADSAPDPSSFESSYLITSDQSISPVAPNAMVISYCAPRIELRLDCRRLHPVRHHRRRHPRCQCHRCTLLQTGD